MSEYRLATREEWLAARKELLQCEKDLTAEVTSSRANGRNCRG